MFLSFKSEKYLFSLFGPFSVFTNTFKFATFSPLESFAEIQTKSVKVTTSSAREHCHGTVCQIEAIITDI